jgi:cysteine desulfurase
MIYLDNAATTKPSESACNEIARVLASNWANPSSVHSIGHRAEKEVEHCKTKFAECLRCSSDRIVFTSCATESINTVLKGFWKAYPRSGRHIITSVTEHMATLETCRYLEKNGIEVTYLPVDGNGNISIAELEKSLRKGTSLFSFTHVNSETGTILNIDELVAFRDRICPEVKIHLDCVQSFGKLPVDIAKTGVDYFSISSHKIHGPKGIGLIYFGPNSKIFPLIHGGGQQKALRSGTVDLASISGFCAASVEAFSKIDHSLVLITTLKQALLTELNNRKIKYVCNSPAEASPYIVNISFPGAKSEVLIRVLGESEIYVSASSACSTKKKKLSYVLSAMNIKDEFVQSAIRISFCRNNTLEEVATFCQKIDDALKILRV